MAAGSAENGLRIALVNGPGDGNMIRVFFVTGITRIVRIAAFKFDGDNIQRRMVVRTSGLVVDYFSFHRYTGKDAFMWCSIHRLGVGMATHIHPVIQILNLHFADSVS